MDKRWILILIIIIVAVVCGYLVLDSSTTVGKAVAVADRCVFTLPDGFSLKESGNTYVEIERDGTPENIGIMEIGKNNTVKQEIKEEFTNGINDSYVFIGNETTKTPKGIEIFTTYYKNSTGNVSSSFFYTSNHTFIVYTIGYKDSAALKKDVNYIADTLRPDYKQAQD